MNRPEWARQNGPQDQLTCVIMGLEGHILNIKDGIPPTLKTLDNMLWHIERLKELNTAMPQSWDKEEK